jgi:hypothetical protein
MAAEKVPAIAPQMAESTGERFNLADVNTVFFALCFCLTVLLLQSCRVSVVF